MRTLLYLLILPLFTSPTWAALDCKQLAPMVQQLEGAFQNSRIPNCQELTSSDDSNIKDNACKNLSAIDLQLASVQNELALLKGISSLKTEIESGMKKIKKDADPQIVQGAAQSFVSNLDVAKTLELLLATRNAKSVNFFSELSGVDQALWDTPAKLGAYISQYCGTNKPQGITICSNNFPLTPETYKEIQGFVGVGSKTGQDKKFKTKHVDELVQALSINQGGRPYSYTQMSQDIKDIKPGILSKDAIKSIRTLPEFSNSTEYDFFNKLKSAKNQLEINSIGANFNSLVDDLRQRQEWELKSKFSILMHEIKEKIPNAGASNECQSAYKLEGRLENCLLPLIKDDKFDNTARAHFRDMISEFNAGEGQLVQLNELQKDCIPGSSLELPGKCFGKVTDNIDFLVKKSEALTQLKNKVIDNNTELMQFRNYAVEEFKKNNCANESHSQIGCYDDLGAISRDVQILTSDILDISLVYAAPLQNPEMEKLCLLDSKGIPFQEAICKDIGKAHAKVEPSLNIDNYNANLNNVNPTTNRNPMREAVMSSVQNFAQGMAQLFAPQQGSLQYPSMPYMNSVQSAGLSYSDKIIMPYKTLGGFGSYSALPNIMPYKGASIATTYYEPRSTYFNYPVGT